MARINTTESMPFPLAKPNADTPVTEAENIGYGQNSVEEEIIDISVNAGRVSLFLRYGYNSNTGELTPLTSSTVFTASQKIPLGNNKKVRCSSTFNVILYYDENDDFLGYNNNGNVLDGSSYFVVGFSSSYPFVEGAYALLESPEDRAVQYTDKNIKISDALSGFDLRQDINVSHGATSGANNYFTAGTFAVGDTVYFCLVDLSSCITGYVILTNNGHYLDGNSSNKLPNKIYSLTVTEENIATLKCGAYIASSRAVSDGFCRFFATKNQSAILGYINSSISALNTSLSGSINTLSTNVSKLSLVEKSLGFDLSQDINVVQGTNSGSTGKFSAATFAVNDVIYFILLDNSCCVSKYALLTANGHTLDGGGTYIYSPNIIYQKTVSNSDVETQKTGAFVNTTNAIGSGFCRFLITKNPVALLKYLNDNISGLVSSVNSQISLLTNKVEGLNDLIGEIQLFDTYGYNVNTGDLTPASASTPFVASQKLTISSGQTTVQVNRSFNVVLFYNSSDEYLGYNGNGNVITNSSYCVVGLARDVRFEKGNFYYVYDPTTLNRRILTLEQSSSQVNSFLTGKSFAVLGDSLSAGNQWENKFAELTGAVYQSGYSQGGERTLSLSGNSGMDRALRLLSEKPNINIIFIQNINDGSTSGTGSKTDIPYMMTQNILSSTTYNNSSAAEAALATEIANVAQPKVGTMIRIKYSVAAIKFTIGNAPSAAGTVTVTIGSNTYGINITSNMTIADVQAKILEYDYTSDGYLDTASGGNAVVFTDSQDRGSSAPAVSIDAGTTGITFTSSDASSVSYIGKCFVSKDISEWADTSKWVTWNTINRYQIYKGLITWLQTNFPNAYIYMLGLPRYIWKNTNDYKYADGTYNWELYKSSITWDSLFEQQKEIAEYMRIGYLDVVNECDISAYNIQTFYPENNVHPLTAGYQRWGETVARIFKK